MYGWEDPLDLENEKYVVSYLGKAQLLLLFSLECRSTGTNSHRSACVSVAQSAKKKIHMVELDISLEWLNLTFHLNGWLCFSLIHICICLSEIKAPELK